jgi:hypothetical protein
VTLGAMAGEGGDRQGGAPTNGKQGRKSGQTRRRSSNRQ